jgi:thymidylate kinase
MSKPGRARRIAIVGLDGCGKSSVITRMRELAPARPGAFASITCPDFHDTPDAPLHRLSRQMKAFSDGCDEIGSAEMKALSMYLQMTLYGPVERFILDTFAPDVLVCERHPLVETFVYGPLYVLLAGSHWDGSALEPAITSVVDGSGAEVFSSVSGWHASETARLGDGLTLWQRFADVAAAVQARFATAVGDFGKRYRTTLPDAVIWLDVPPEQAAARCAVRRPSGLVETHETPGFLAILREGYLRFQESMAREFPNVPIHVVDTSDGVDVDSSVRACIAEGRLFG